MLSSADPIRTDGHESLFSLEGSPASLATEHSMPELKTRLHWLMGLRVVVVTLMLGLSLAFQATRGELAVTFSVLIGVTYFITIAMSISR